MLVVNIELWPFGDRTNADLERTIVIWNDGTGTHARGNYKYRIGRKHGDENPHDLAIGEAKPYRQGEIKGFPRRSLTEVDLLARVLADALDKHDSI